MIHISRLSGKVQKTLSKAVTVLEMRDAEAMLHTTLVTGRHEKVGLALAAEQRVASAPFRVQPWMDDGDMHWGSADVLVTTALRYGLDLPAELASLPVP